MDTAGTDKKAAKSGVQKGRTTIRTHSHRDGALTGDPVADMRYDDRTEQICLYFVGPPAEEQEKDHLFITEVAYDFFLVYSSCE